MTTLDIFSDPICPWCLIGKSLLDRALESRPAHPFQVVWHPFQLNPQMPRGGMDRRDYLEQKFGSKENAVRVYARIAEAAKAAGVEIHFEKMRRTPNTMDAHRLIHWAGIEGRQNAVVSALFSAYFREGADIGQADVLLAIAERAGMDRAVVTRLLTSDSDLSEIRTRDFHARSRGITSVPTFIVDHAHAVPGAQPTALWQSVIDDLLAQTAQSGAEG